MEGAPSTDLDLVFACDCTGSMSSYIQSAKDNITKIMEKIQASEKRDVQFALISYRDHPPQDSSYVTKVYPFTKSVSKAKSYVNEMSADGGGDTPEAVAAALHEALNLPYRKSATKVLVIVADAPPHGLTKFESGDGFPNGSPDGADPMVDANQMAERGIVVYSVGCEPTLSSSPYARHFFKTIASITGGRYIALGNALILPDVIIGGAEEEIALEKLAKEMEVEKKNVEEQAKKNSETLSEEQLTRKVMANLQSRGVKTPQMSVGALPVGEAADEELVNKMVEIPTLPKLKEMLDAAGPPNRTTTSSSSYSFASSISSSSAVSAPAYPSSTSYSPTSPSYSPTSPSYAPSAFGAPAPSGYPSSSYGSAPMPSMPPPSSSAYAAQAMEMNTSDISYEQVDRCMKRNKKRK